MGLGMGERRGAPLARIRRVWGLLAALLVVVPGIAAIGMWSPAAAASAVGSAPSASWGVNGNVYATAIVGDTAFVGGSFSAAISPTGSAVPRKNLAAFSMSTGALLTSWRADAGSAVRSLASDGTWLYVGGSFGRIGGAAHLRLARLSVATGQPDQGFSASVDGTVRAMALGGGSLYIGGVFNTVDGVGQSRLAKVDPSSGVLDGSFSAPADNNVYGLALSPSTSTLYVAGAFTRLGGATRNGVGAVSAGTGATTPLAFTGSARPTLGLSMNADGTLLYGAGGGSSNAAAAWSTSTGARVWRVVTGGDIQAIDYYAGQVYFGFHDNYQGNSRTKLLAADATTGQVDPAFRPVFNDFWGVYAIDVSGLGLSVGGDFTTVSGVVANHWARFSTG